MALAPAVVVATLGAGSRTAVSAGAGGGASAGGGSPRCASAETLPGAGGAAGDSGASAFAAVASVRPDGFTRCATPMPSATNTASAPPA
ncbi:Uncharacterised protein [Burkholderia pseudomallei]|nr:Uncharacterised protein [Burkholderia pseudomallei]CAJ6552964.1 Uncharacterised protein [Burkholderia pseudomallei]CAJ7916486.1 Uncharacterised protein [Burkholderia pseudomallei]